MKTAIFEKAGSMIIEEVAKPTIQAGDDVILRIVRACVCGSDLWSYSHGDARDNHTNNSGHEALAVVEEVGPDITTLVRVTLSLLLLPMAVAIVRLVALALMVPVIIILCQLTGAVVFRQSICVFTMATGR